MKIIRFIAKLLIAHPQGWIKTLRVCSYFQSVRPLLSCDITFDIAELVSRRVRLPHPVGVVMGKGVLLGYDCVIYQNVTIGARSPVKGGYPTLGDRVTVFPGAIIIGPIHIGDDAVVGAGAVVFDSVPAGAIVRGGRP